MSKQISEMTLDELRDHALNQAQQLAAATQRESELNTKITELTGLNQALQTRNNNLFVQLEQQTAAPAEKEKQPDPVHVDTCEEIGAKIARGEI